ncbi:MAG: CBS domain-containing protein [Gemmataceae bacterium]|nr:CBS domain-containing protein [Gemmataceae bacterium]MDW8241922.1 CBS domain-containing protein [Thermogemmata sp.]
MNDGMHVKSILNDPVTLHMRTDPCRLRLGQTVREALEYVRKQHPSGRIVYFYVVDEQDRLVGVVPTRQLLLSDPETLVANIMVRSVIAIPHTATVLEACEFFTMHRFLAFPVVDDQKRLLGLVDVELYTKELSDLERREGNEDLFQLIGVHLTEASQRNVLTTFRSRFPWLLSNITGGLLAAWLADAYADVATLVLVTPFIPVVLALAESVSIQSVSLALETLHGVRATWGLYLRRLVREAVVGLLLGAACGGLVALVAWLWKGHLGAGLSLFLGISGSVAAAAILGLSLPLILRLLRYNPQVAAGPIALASADMVTLLFYFNLGRWLLGTHTS